ncbi:MAG: hydroxymethylglutaryl-CoA reductase, degradative [Psychroflexus sp.]|nr:hydroxymethylglutaryl-CoA reductase, degradative [Psychroflexus sp.]MDR9448396.1 hydroxymethylglutaryl-CoA reductase, degradative [Psychroflexus sp.]
MTKIAGFSKLSKDEKINWICENYLDNNQKEKDILKQYWNVDSKLQKLHDEFSENTISNFYLPFGVAPNFVINGKDYLIPMAIEESSVVAAASKAAKFWGKRGGFKTKVFNTTKIGHVHFSYEGDSRKLERFFKANHSAIMAATQPITRNMEKRGGGLTSIELKNKTAALADYYQLECKFQTVDAMGANFINTCLEKIAATFELLAEKSAEIENKDQLLIIMSILSNYVPECLVEAWVSCPVKALAEAESEQALFVKKFKQAVSIANVEPYRAVTHNKGIMNGIDAVVLATGNDFRAIEACVHTYAGRSGKYQSLTDVKVEDGIFEFKIQVPLAVGTIGGLTSLHPLVKLALRILNNPSAEELMQVMAVAGLAQNFGALHSLVTSGIQKGHMKMHLMNILNQFEATEQERLQAIDYFKTHTATHNEVVNFINRIRS